MFVKERIRFIFIVLKVNVVIMFEKCLLNLKDNPIEEGEVGEIKEIWKNYCPKNNIYVLIVP